MNKLDKNIDSIIFDLDGTLWDSTEVVLKVWCDVIKNHEEVRETITKEDLQGCMGLQVKDIGAKLFPYLDVESRQSILEDCCEVQCHYLKEEGGRLFDGLEETLSTLSKRYKLFIVSNCEEDYIESFYHFHKLDKYFIDFEHPGRTGLHKGENIKLLMERNNLKNPIYVGDTEGDCKAAKFAGISFVYARYGFGKVEETDFIIDSIGDLLKLIPE